MKYFSKEIPYHAKAALISLVFFSISTCGLYSQSNAISIFFSKPDESIVAGTMSFNIVKIFNPHATPITGELNISAPTSWSLISSIGTTITLAPTDTTYIPIHISPASNATGGVSYIISALFRADDRAYLASASIAIQAKSNWDFKVHKTNLYVTQTNPNTDLRIKLSNRGNTNELIRLDYNAGKLIAFKGSNLQYTEFINLPAYADTTLLQTVSYRTNLHPQEAMRLSQNWRESSVIISATNKDDKRSTALQLQRLTSSFKNTRNQNATPLNIDYQMFNLMSAQPIRHSLKLYGSILFKNKRELQYFGGLNGLYLNDLKSGFNLERNLLYNLSYKTPRSHSQIGYNVSNASLHVLSGRGLVGKLLFGKNTNLDYSIIQNHYSNLFGQSASLSTSIKGLSLSAEIVNESSYVNSYKATSAGAGFGFSLFKNQNIAINVLGSRITSLRSQLPDTTQLGFSYRLVYNLRLKNFDFRFTNTNSQNNYIMHTGINQSYLDARLRFSDKFFLTAYGNRQQFGGVRMVPAVVIPENKNISEFARITLSMHAGNIVYQFGPNFIASERITSSGMNNYKNTYLTAQPGVWMASTVKLGAHRSITPSLTVSNIRFRFYTKNPDLMNYSVDNALNYSAGLSFFDTNWRVLAYYTSGSTTDLYRSVQVDDKPTLSSSIQLRPSYENYVFDGKAKVSAYLNYAYFMPSGRENINYNLKYDQFLQNGWTITLNANMYSNTRIVSQEQGRVSSKDINVILAISKAFNIQQPRLKYYNLKTVFYNDLDGNRMKSDNEPPVSDVLVAVEKNKLHRNEQSNLPEIKLISDAKGAVYIENLPQDAYRFRFSPLSNLDYLFFLNGDEQIYQNNGNNTLYVPLAESFKIKGRVHVKRDPHSSEGKIELGGIRVTAKAENGENYSVLTDNFGNFVMGVPNANRFNVKISNVLGEHFQLENDEITVQFTSNKTVHVDFLFVEKKREIQFDGGSQFYKFNSITN